MSAAKRWLKGLAIAAGLGICLLCPPVSVAVILWFIIKDDAEDGILDPWNKQD